MDCLILAGSLPRCCGTVNAGPGAATPPPASNHTFRRCSAPREDRTAQQILQGPGLPLWVPWISSATFLSTSPRAGGPSCRTTAGSPAPWADSRDGASLIRRGPLPRPRIPCRRRELVPAPPPIGFLHPPGQAHHRLRRPSGVKRSGSGSSCSSPHHSPPGSASTQSRVSNPSAPMGRDCSRTRATPRSLSSHCSAATSFRSRVALSGLSAKSRA